MSREKWRLIRQSKEFYQSTYRRVSTMLLISVSINLLLGIIDGRAYLSRPDPDYYSTNGVTPPQVLVSMDSPNFTSVPMLPDDLVDEEEAKVMPE